MNLPNSPGKLPTTASPPAPTALVCAMLFIAALSSSASAQDGAPIKAPVDISPDGILGFTPNRADGSVSISDLLNKTALATVKACAQPERGVVTPDGVNYIVACSADNSLVYINSAAFNVVATVKEKVGQGPVSISLTADGRFGMVKNAAGATLSILDLARREIVAAVSPAQEPRKEGKPNEVLVMGTIHGEHNTSKLFGIEALKAIIKRIKPDVVLVEIPPNRFEAASEEFAASGTITERRVKSFPEYVKVLFPLQKEVGYTIVPTAGWNFPMHNYRNAVIKRLETDPARSKEWAALNEGEKKSKQALNLGGKSDNPAFIHTDAYDQALELQLVPYNHFNADIGPGGWDNINTTHYGYIAQWLRQHAFEGKRVLITYGAGHKGWFLRQLRQRKDIRLLEMKPFL